MPQLKACILCGAWIAEHGPAKCRRCAPAPTGNTSWNGTRDRAEQRRFRRMLIDRDGLRCRGCGATGVPLQAHHDTPTDGRLLCDDCHTTADPHARRTSR